MFQKPPHLSHLLKIITLKILDAIWKEIGHNCFCGRSIGIKKGLCDLCFKKISFLPQNTCKICCDVVDQSLSIKKTSDAGLDKERFVSAYPLYEKELDKNKDVVRAKNKNMCFRCYQDRPSFDNICCGIVYSGIAKKMVHSFKFEDKEYLADILTKFMKSFFKIEHNAFYIITCVPMHKTKIKEQKYNHSALLARSLFYLFKERVLEMSLSNIVLKLDLIEKTKKTKPQRSLEKLKRINNLKGCFRVKNMSKKPIRDLIKKHANKKIVFILVDDVVTTGSTVHNCSIAIKSTFKSAIVEPCCFARSIIK